MSVDLEQVGVVVGAAGAVVGVAWRVFRERSRRRPTLFDEGDGEDGRSNGHTAARALYTAAWYRDVTERLAEVASLREILLAVRADIAEMRRTLDAHVLAEDAALGGIGARLGSIEGATGARLAALEREVLRLRRAGPGAGPGA